MDLNSRINWTQGMEISAQTLIGMDDKYNFQHQIAIRAALGSTRMGMLPGANLQCNGIFVKNTFEIERLQCMALLPSGQTIDVDEPAVISIPMLLGDFYYLTIGIGEGVTEFEKEGVAYIRPHYEYGLYTLEEVEAKDVMPIVRFNVHDGVFAIEQNYIPPCLLLTSDQRFKDYLNKFKEQLQNIVSHQNLEEGEGKRAMMHYLFILKSYSLKNSVSDFVKMLQEIVQALDYYVVTPNVEEPISIQEPTQVDVAMWLGWFGSYLEQTIAILNKVVLEDKTIDYDALLRQAKAELYAQLHEELIVKLLSETKEELLNLVKEELENSLSQQTLTLTNFINDTLKPDIFGQLQAEMKRSLAQMEDNLSESLYERLYEELFEHLFNALYVPEPEDEKFVPLI